MTAVHRGRLPKRRVQSAAAIDIATLSSCLTSSDSEYDHSTPFSGSPACVADASATVSSAIRHKRGDFMEAGERLAEKLLRAQKITMEQVLEIRRSFKYFDKNGDGSISLDELTSAFSVIGRTYDRKLIKSLFQEADENGDGSIDYKEFVALMANSFQQRSQTGTPTASRDDMYREAFNKFDTNNDGVIDSEDLKRLMKNIGKQLSDKEILEMILEADENGDGVVDYDVGVGDVGVTKLREVRDGDMIRWSCSAQRPSPGGSDCHSEDVEIATDLLAQML